MLPQLRSSHGDRIALQAHVSTNRGTYVKYSLTTFPLMEIALGVLYYNLLTTFREVAHCIKPSLGFLACSVWSRWTKQQPLGEPSVLVGGVNSRDPRWLHCTEP